MPEDVGVDAEGPRAARAPRGLVFVAALVLALGLAVAANTLGEGSTQPPPRPPPADLVHIAELTTVVAGRPQVRPPAGFRVIARAPSRLPLIHEIRYGSGDLGVAPALGDGLTYTGLTSGGGFEDALYVERATPAGTVHGAPVSCHRYRGATALLPGSRHLAWSRTSAGAEPR